MHIVTVEAVFSNRRMLKSEGPSFLSMTRVAQFVDAVRLEHFWSKAAVGVVTVGAFHLSFLYGMMRLPVCHHPDILVTVEAEIRLFGLQAFLYAPMDRVAISA